MSKTTLYTNTRVPFGAQMEKKKFFLFLYIFELGQPRVGSQRDKRGIRKDDLRKKIRKY
jgi:hypothetical protein